jgi:hypothetical protein
VRGFAVQGEREVLGRRSTHARFALAIIGMRKKEEQAHDEREHQPGIQFPYQSFVQAPYNKGIREPKASGLGGSQVFD